MLPLIAGAAIKSVLDVFATTSEQSQRKSKLEGIIAELQAKEKEYRAQAKSQYNKVYYGSLRQGMNFVNENVPQASGYLNPNARKANFVKVGAQAHMAGLQAEELYKQKADEAFYKALGLKAETPDVNLLSAIADSGTEFLGNMIGIEQVNMQDEFNQKVLDVYGKMGGDSTKASSPYAKSIKEQFGYNLGAYTTPETPTLKLGRKRR